MGITGAVACGKSTLGQVFLGEFPYRGSIRFGGRELRDLEIPAVVGYLGHQPELLCDSIRENILLGDTGSCRPWLEAVCMQAEVDAMEQGEKTVVGSGGIRLSGGQQAGWRWPERCATGGRSWCWTIPFPRWTRPQRPPFCTASAQRQETAWCCF